MQKTKKMFIFKAIISLMTLVAISQALNEEKYWLISCKLTGCSFAFSSCMNCFGERACKSCISLSKPECSVCADDIYNKDDLETINGNQYLICDSFDPIQSTICHFYCRGQFAQSGECVVENGLPICKCSSQSGSITNPSTLSSQQTLTTTNHSITTPSTLSSQQTLTTTKQSTQTTNKPAASFNGNVKLNVSINSYYQRILPLPNGDLVRGSYSNLIEIWDMQQGVIKRNLSSDYSKPWVFGLLSNGDLVAGYLSSQTLLIWDLKTVDSEPLKKIIQTSENFYCLTILKNDDLAIGQSSNSYDIVIRNSQDGSIKKKLIGHQGIVYQIIELDNGNLVSCSNDGVIRVWNVTSGFSSYKRFYTPVISIALLKNAINCIAFYRLDGKISIWNLETSEIRDLVVQSSIVRDNCLQVLDNGDLLSGSDDKSIQVWNPYDGALKLTTTIHKSGVHQLAISPKGNIISSSSDELIVWN